MHEPFRPRPWQLMDNHGAVTPTNIRPGIQTSRVLFVSLLESHTFLVTANATSVAQCPSLQALLLCQIVYGLQVPAGTFAFKQCLGPRHLHLHPGHSSKLQISIEFKVCTMCMCSSPRRHIWAVGAWPEANTRSAQQNILLSALKVSCLLLQLDGSRRKLHSSQRPQLP